MLEVYGALFIIILGIIFHFVYDWSHHNKIIGFFTSVNESTWEHLKLILAPSFLWMLFEYHFYSDNSIYFFARFISIFSMLLIIPIIFYTYRYIAKKNSSIVNILSFFVAPIIGQIIFHILINSNINNSILKHIGVIGLIYLFLRYITRTYVPTKDFLHKDPITNKYGIEANK